LESVSASTLSGSVKMSSGMAIFLLSILAIRSC
jgi:hypothetical protein